MQTQFSKARQICWEILDAVKYCQGIQSQVNRYH